MVKNSVVINVLTFTENYRISELIIDSFRYSILPV